MTERVKGYSFIPPDPPYPHPYGKQNVLPTSEIEKILSEPIEAMRLLAIKHGISLPTNLERRVAVVGNSAFDFDGGEALFKPVVAGLTLPNRLCLVNYLTHQTEAKSKKKIYQLLIATAVHELWHSVSCQELWIPPGFNTDEIASLDERFYRRYGIFTARTCDCRNHIYGLHFLEEGLTERLTQSVLQLCGIRTAKESYKKQLLLISLLMDKLGEDPFFQAKLTKQGLRSLYRLLEATFGENALVNIAQAAWIDQSNELMQAFGRRKTKKAQKYIQDENYRQKFIKEQKKEAEEREFWDALNR